MSRLSRTLDMTSFELRKGSGQLSKRQRTGDEAARSPGCVGLTWL
ncbi:MAG: hypothetical protein P8K08_24140 [Fuerstiella sp.]|nr:hypothetical protein [Fuerstiella sp.]